MASGVSPIASAGDRPNGTRRADLVVPAAASLAAFLLLIVCFAPRFVYWPWLDLDPAERHPPEFNRAIDTLRQLDNPFMQITNPINRVINWRLIFPILGHYLRLPWWVFLSLPTVGCLLVLGYVANLARRESKSWWVVLGVSALTGTTSWFFVSTGWLGYFDSWCVLGLLVAAFSRSKIATALACLLTPWVDERFVLTLPLVIVVRGIYSSEIEHTTRTKLLADGFRYFSLVAPYCALRLVALATTQDEGSAVHLRDHISSMHNAWQVADGLWSGLRIFWAFAAVAPVLLLFKGRVARAAILLVGMVATLVVNVPLAHDLSRSSSTMVPAAVLGVLLLLRARASLARRLIAVALAFNLFTPAWHVIEGWNDKIPIYSLRFEVYRFKHTPTQVVELHLQRASKFVAQGQLPMALSAVEAAVRIGPASIGAHLDCGKVLNALGRPVEATVHYDIAVALGPRRPEVYVQRAQFRLLNQKLKAASEDLRSALELLPGGSPVRPALEAELAKINRALVNP